MSLSLDIQCWFTFRSNTVAYNLTSLNIEPFENRPKVLTLKWGNFCWSFVIQNQTINFSQLTRRILKDIILYPTNFYLQKVCRNIFLKSGLQILLF